MSYSDDICNKIKELEANKWYNISPSRPDLEDFLQALQLSRELYQNVVISPNKSAFKRIRTYKDFEKTLESTIEITFVMEFRNIDEVEFDYSDLPEPVSTPENKKIKRRAV